MIELPEAKAISTELNHVLKGVTILDAIVLQTKHQLAWMNDTVEYYSKTLQNRLIHQVLHSGGMVRIVMDEKIELVISEDVEIGYVNKSDVPEKHQLLLTLSNQMYLYLKVKMYAFMLLGSPSVLNENIYYQRSTTAIDPLSDFYTLDIFKKDTEMDKGVGSLKSALATKQHIPGLGNGILQDILLNAGFRPDKKVSSMQEADIRNLYDAMKKNLSLMIEHGGRAKIGALSSALGGYQVLLDGKTNECPKCHQSVIKKAYLGGKVIYCPHCQKE
jgi:formamidopyrimidine-DNA glycosylase